MSPNAYDAARTYARYLRDFGDLARGTVLRLEPHKDGVAVVCEPGPNPATVQDFIGERGTLYWYGGAVVFGGEPLPDLDADPEWRSIPMPVFAEGIDAEAEDGVTLVFMADGERATIFPAI